ncbi:hypothetical protein AB1L30_15970 [Bremerella sp. JC817]|uniref:hypothetical protein n=1 Tax=Bremerella sp. JC817 TaxID=3231756 RepID=UPI00345AB8C7
MSQSTDKVDMVLAPCRMLFEDVTVVVSRGSWGTAPVVDFVEVQFAWRGGADKLRLANDKHTKDELQNFYDEFAPYNGKDCRVVFKTQARPGQYGNAYKLLEVDEITLLSDGPVSKAKPTSSGVI